MVATTAEMEAHLEQRDSESRSIRVERFRTVAKIFDFAEEGIGLWGGSGSAQTFSEMRFAYMDGLFLTTTLLAVACAEQEIAGMLHAAGDDSAATAHLSLLIDKALGARILDIAQVEELHNLRDIRNSYAHYRTLQHRGNWILRAVTEEVDHAELLERDALLAMRVLAGFLKARLGYR